MFVIADVGSQYVNLKWGDNVVLITLVLIVTDSLVSVLGAGCLGVVVLGHF